MSEAAARILSAINPKSSIPVLKGVIYGMLKHK